MFIVYRASQWHHTLNQAAGDPADPIDASHKGPIISYLYVPLFLIPFVRTGHGGRVQTQADMTRSPARRCPTRHRRT